MAKTKKKKDLYDKQVLYLASVQCPEADVAFFKKTFKKPDLLELTDILNSSGGKTGNNISRFSNAAKVNNEPDFRNYKSKINKKSLRT